MEPAHCFMSGSDCCFLTCMQVLQEADKVVWYSHLFKYCPQLVVMNIVKAFSRVNEAEVDAFLELSGFICIDKYICIPIQIYIIYTIYKLFNLCLDTYINIYICIYKIYMYKTLNYLFNHFIWRK